jgi:peptidoglycan/LPS O-acetylase OafA/YrhL
MRDTKRDMTKPISSHSSLQTIQPESALLTEAEPAAPRAPLLTRHRAPLHALTGLRFFAAAYVIMFHTRLGPGLNSRGFHLAGNFVLNGYLAVTLFFMLSGFILAYNYRGQIETRNHVFRFWEARVARIWPAYLFSLLCSSFPLSHVPRFPLAMMTIFMVQSWDPFHPEYAGLWNFVCWSLSVEAFFYLVFPFLQTSIEKLRRVHLIVFGAAVVLFCALFNTPYHSMLLRYTGAFYLIPVPLIQLPTFIAGVFLGNLFLLVARRTTGLEASVSGDYLNKGTLRADSPKPRARFAYITWIGLAASVATLCTAQQNWEGLAVASFSLLLLGLAFEPTILSRFLSTRILILGGEISYAMYLLRTPVQAWVLAFPALHANLIVDLLYVPLVVVPLSLLCFYFIEGPSRRALRRIFAILQASRAT